MNKQRIFRRKSNTKSSSNPLMHIAGELWMNSSASRLMESMCYHIGPRPPATSAMRQAQKLLSLELQDLGAHSLQMEPVPIRTWCDRPSTLELLSPYRRKYDSYHLVHSAQANRIEARLLQGGNASVEDLNRLDKRVQGAAILISGFDDSGSSGGMFVPLPLRIKAVAERGAAAAVVRSPVASRLPTVELGGVNNNIPIPAISVSASASDELAFFCKMGRTKLAITADGVSAPGTCANLTAELGPRQADLEVIVLSAHLDTFFNNSGAFDNLTGVLTLMEIARVLAPHQSRFKRALRLIVFTGEEYGFIGSKSYVERHAHEHERIKFVFNMDSLFAETAKGIAVMWAPEMRDYIAEKLRNAPWKVDVRNMFCMSSDYLPFLLAGITTARPAHWMGKFPPQSHTILDTPDRVPLNWIRQNALIFAYLLFHILSDPSPLPLFTKSVEQVRSLLKQEGVVEQLRCYDFAI